MRPSVVKIFPGSQRLLRCSFTQSAAAAASATAARQRPNRQLRRPAQSLRYHNHTRRRPSLSPSTGATPVHDPNTANMDMPNMQWWAKPAPTMTAPANQQPSSNGFAIPGLGNAANAPFSASSSGAIPLPARPVTAGHTTTRKGRRTPVGAASNSRPKTPTAASGGVPNPTPEYLHRASLPPTVLPVPRPILVVMDLNGTLLHRPNRRQTTSFIERPHARRFLQYCLDTFHVVIWSSARPSNVQSMCDQLLLGPPGGGAGDGHQADRGSYRRRVLAVWGRDRFGLSDADYKLRVQVYKRLDMVWREKAVQAAHPAAAYGGRWDQSNTVLVDDSLEKARSEPYNLLQIPEFFGDTSEPGYVVPQVHDYLNALCYQSDISAYMRENPFTMRDDYRLVPAEH